MFYGIIVRMFYDDHNPPHFHVNYENYSALFNFDGTLIEGKIPKRQQKLIEAWVLLHKDELIANWNLLKNNEPLFYVKPLV